MLTVTIKKEVSETVEFQVPSFRRNMAETDYVGILDEKTIVAVHRGKLYSSVCNGEPQIMDAQLKESRSYQSCSEQEFLEAYDAVIQSMNLSPILAV